MTNETQPFDQTQADDLRNAFWAAFETSWKSNPHNNHNNAQQGLEAVIARLAARQPAPVVGDEAREKAARAMYDWEWETGFAPYEKLREHYLSLVDAAVPALAAQAVQVPEWVNHLEIHRGSIPEYEESFGKWHCALRGDKDQTGSFRMVSIREYRETWHDALRAAIEQAKGGQE